MVTSHTKPIFARKFEKDFITVDRRYHIADDAHYERWQPERQSEIWKLLLTSDILTRTWKRNKTKSRPRKLWKIRKTISQDTIQSNNHASRLYTEDYGKTNRIFRTMNSSFSNFRLMVMTTKSDKPTHLLGIRTVAGPVLACSNLKWIFDSSRQANSRAIPIT